MSQFVTLNVYSGAFPLITVNSLKFALYKQSDPLVEVTSQTFAAPHPIRTVSFPGLERTNYKLKVIEMNGVTPVAEKANFDVVPDDNTEVAYYAPVEIQADVTPGIVSGTGSNSFTFDGTSGTFDWRGREIYVERVGQGTMQRDAQYTWNTTTGMFTLLAVGDEIQPSELFNVEFGLVVTPTSGGVPPFTLFSALMIITGTTTLLSADANKKILIQGASNSFDITMPDIATTAALTPFYFEAGIGAHINVRIKCAAGQTIDWGKGARTDVKIGVCESIVIYKQVISPGVNVWRVHDAKGNFLTVGRIVTSDADVADEYNCKKLDGSSLSIIDYARLYEDFVQQLPPSQVCNFADWGTGDNKYKFSYASGGLFKIPDRRNLFTRNSDGSNLPGFYSADKVGPVTGTATLPKGFSYTGGPNQARIGNGANTPQDIAGHTISIITGNSETVPKHFVTNLFVLI